MTEAVKRQLIIEPLSGFEPEIGRMLWMMEDARHRTLKVLNGIEQQVMDWQPPANGNSIGTLLYHIAAIEMDWLAVEVMDPRELALADVGLLHLVDPETGRVYEVQTSDARLRERYAAARRR